MSLPLNTALPLNKQTAPRLVAASLAGNQAHVLRVFTPYAPDTYSFIDRLYKAQSCKRIAVAAPFNPEAVAQLLDDTAQQIANSNQPLAVIAVCGEPKACNQELLAGLCNLLADRPATVLVELLPHQAYPQIAHFLTCADAQQAT